MTATLDTLAIARDLAKRGFTQEQADAVADTIRQAANLPDISRLVTKADLEAGLAELRSSTKADLADVRNDIAALKADIANSVAGLRGDLAITSTTTRTAIADAKIDTLKWVIGIMVASVGINVGAIIALVKMLGHP